MRRAIPVTGPGRVGVKASSAGICYRIMSEYVFDSTRNLGLRELQESTGLGPDSIDVILDLGYITESYVDRCDFLTRRINAVAQMGEWRSLILAAGSFPADLTGRPKGFSTIDRHEWSLWSLLVTSKKLVRTPMYSDYGIQNPEQRESPPFSGLANIRYTTTSRWDIFRGEKIDPNLESNTISALMKGLCIMASAHPDFCNDLCEADEYIKSCAANERDPANDHATWKRVGFQHHMAFVVRQVASALAA